MQSVMPLRLGYPEVTKLTTRGVFKSQVTSRFEIGGGKPLEVRNKEIIKTPQSKSPDSKVS